MAVPPSRQWTRGPGNELHAAARRGSVERTLAVISRGEIDIDDGDPNGWTALMAAASFGHSRVVRTLLNKGANMSIADDGGITALHFAARKGSLAVTKLLVKAGAELEAKTSTVGSTPLHTAAEEGHSGVMGVLIEAGANLNSHRANGGATPLFIAAQHGRVAATKLLLRAKANPLMTCSRPSGSTFVPLDVAAFEGHSEVVQELIQECGIEGCGGASGGVNALELAAENQHVEILGILTSAGVVDTGIALITAAIFGRESSMKFLLRQHERDASSQRAEYLQVMAKFGGTPLVCSIQACSPRITRLLMDAGADATTAVRLMNTAGVVCFNDTPLALVDLCLSDKTIIAGGEGATESQLHSLEAVRRLLLRVEAVHALSWLWAKDASSITHTAAGEGTNGATTTSPTPLISMLPVLRRRASRPRVLLAALSRHSGKPS